MRSETSAEKQLRNDVNTHILGIIETVCDHHNYVVLETNRQSDLYQFWTKYRGEDVTSNWTVDKDQCHPDAPEPKCPQVKQYIKNSLPDASEEDINSLATSCAKCGLNAQLTHTLHKANKMDKHLNDEKAKEQIKTFIGDAKTQILELNTNLDSTLAFIEERRAKRKAGKVDRSKTMENSKLDIITRYNNAHNKINEVHSKTMDELTEQLNAPLEIPEVNVNLIPKSNK